MSLPIATRRFNRLGAAIVVLVGGLLLPGCVRVLALGAKVFMGDPKVVSTFEQRTHVKLQDGDHAVAVVVDAPHQVYNRFDRLVDDVQTELLHQMRLHGIQVVDSSEVNRALNAAAGSFDPALIAQATDADYIMHVKIEAFTDGDAGSSSLLQCRCQGLVTGYEVRGETGSADRQVVARYEEPFLTRYPHGQPALADHEPRGTFLGKCSREIAGVIGRQMYDVYTRDSL